MTAIYPYLTFENAKEAMAYYRQESLALKLRISRGSDKEQAESLGLPVDQLDQTTMRGGIEFMIAGQKLFVPDATMGNPLNVYANFNFT